MVRDPMLCEQPPQGPNKANNATKSPHSSRLRWALGVLVVSGAATLAGCAPLQQSALGQVETTAEAQVEDVVKARAQARWAARISQDSLAEYAFQTPSYREMFAHDQWVLVTRGNLLWEEAAVSAVNCVDQVCTVSVEVRYRVPNAPTGLDRPISTTLRERWIEEGGQWWFAARVAS